MASLAQEHDLMSMCSNTAMPVLLSTSSSLAAIELDSICAGHEVASTYESKNMQQVHTSKRDGCLSENFAQIKSMSDAHVAIEHTDVCVRNRLQDIDIAKVIASISSKSNMPMLDLKGKSERTISKPDKMSMLADAISTAAISNADNADCEHAMIVNQSISATPSAALPAETGSTEHDDAITDPGETVSFSNDCMRDGDQVDMGEITRIVDLTNTTLSTSKIVAMQTHLACTSSPVHLLTLQTISDSADVENDKQCEIDVKIIPKQEQLVSPASSLNFVLSSSEESKGEPEPMDLDAIAAAAAAAATAAMAPASYDTSQGTFDFGQNGLFPAPTASSGHISETSKSKTVSSASEDILLELDQSNAFLMSISVDTSNSTSPTQSSSSLERPDISTFKLSHSENRHGNLVRPNVPYATLITNAIESSPNRRITLNDIYNYAMEHYSYFRTAGNGWKNSIRHNLSLNKSFVRVPRPANEKGKGAYWTLSSLESKFEAQFAARKNNLLSKTSSAVKSTNKSEKPDKQTKASSGSQNGSNKKNRFGQNKQGVSSSMQGSKRFNMQSATDVEGAQFVGFDSQMFRGSAFHGPVSTMTTASGSIPAVDATFEGIPFIYDHSVFPIDSASIPSSMQLQDMSSQSDQTQVAFQSNTSLHGSMTSMNHSQFGASSSHMQQNPYAIISSDLFMQSPSSFSDDLVMIDAQSQIHRLIKQSENSKMGNSGPSVGSQSLTSPIYSRQSFIAQSVQQALMATSGSFSQGDAHAEFDINSPSSTGTHKSPIAHPSDKGSDAVLSSSRLTEPSEYTQQSTDGFAEHKQKFGDQIPEPLAFSVDCTGSQMRDNTRRRGSASTRENSIDTSLSGSTSTNENMVSVSSFPEAIGPVEAIGPIANFGPQGIHGAFLVAPQGAAQAYGAHDSAIAVTDAFGNPLSYNGFGFVGAETAAPVFYGPPFMNGPNYPVIYDASGSTVSNLAFGNPMMAAENAMHPIDVATPMVTQPELDSTLAPVGMFSINYPSEMNTIVFDHAMHDASSNSSANEIHSSDAPMAVMPSFSQEAWLGPDTCRNMYSDLPIAVYRGAQEDMADLNEHCVGSPNEHMETMSSDVTTPSQTGASALSSDRDVGPMDLQAVIDDIKNRTDSKVNDTCERTQVKN